MNKLIGFSVLALSFVAGCEPRDTTKGERPAAGEARTPSSQTPMTTTPAPTPAPEAGAPAAPSSTLPGRGEGEGEQQLDTQVADESAAAGLSDQQLNTQYRKEIASDPDLAATASNTQLISSGGQLVLRGTVPSEDLKQALGEMAKVLADGREIKNEITVAEPQKAPE